MPPTSNRISQNLLTEESVTYSQRAATLVSYTAVCAGTAPGNGSWSNIISIDEVTNVGQDGLASLISLSVNAILGLRETANFKKLRLKVMSNVASMDGIPRTLIINGSDRVQN